METTSITLIVFLLLVITAAGVLVLVAIRDLKKRQSQSSMKDKHQEAEKQQLSLGVEQKTSQKLVENKQHQLGSEIQGFEEEQKKTDKESKYLKKSTDSDLKESRQTEESQTTDHGTHSLVETKEHFQEADSHLAEEDRSPKNLHRKPEEQKPSLRSEQKTSQRLEEKSWKADEKPKHLEEEIDSELEEVRQAEEFQTVEHEQSKLEKGREHPQEDTSRLVVDVKPKEELFSPKDIQREPETQQSSVETKQEESQIREEEIPQPVRQERKKEQPPKVKRETNRLEPVKRGGRPRAPAQGSVRQPSQEARSRHRKPEIVCWQKERQWILGLEVPEELLENSGLEVIQDEKHLIQDEDNEGIWRLEQFIGDVIVRSDEESPQQIELASESENYLVFKLIGRNQTRGRRVGSPSSGSYLVVVPENWSRDERLSGRPSVAPEPVFLEGYHAHFFELDRDTSQRIAFQTAAGKSIQIRSVAPRFELFGMKKLKDANEDMGPLFVEKPPQIKALHSQLWTDIGTIVVGEEGGGRGRWRKQFAPEPERIEQDLPTEIANKKSGWYYIRFYDQNYDLVESLVFRFIDKLKNIRISEHTHLPAESGYSPVSIEFFHEIGCSIQMMGELLTDIVQIERQDDKITLTIPPNPVGDENRWLVKSDGGAEVKVTLLIERVWWSLGEEGKKPSEWVDKALPLSRDDFKATSNKAIWFKLPRPRWIDKLYIGFEEQRFEPYKVRVEENMIAIPLRNLGELREVADRAHEQRLKVLLPNYGNEVAIVAVIPAEQPKRQEFLNIDIISPPRLASVLTRIRKVTSGPLRVLIREVRQEYPRRHAPNHDCVEFERKDFV